LGKAKILRNLEAIVFYNSGVKLLTKSSFVLQPLVALQEQGIDLIACGTCVKHFGLDDQIDVGQIGTMDGILSNLERAEKVITL